MVSIVVEIRTPIGRKAEQQITAHRNSAPLFLFAMDTTKMFLTSVVMLFVTVALYLLYALLAGHVTVEPSQLLLRVGIPRTSNDVAHSQDAKSKAQLGNLQSPKADSTDPHPHGRTRAESDESPHEESSLGGPDTPSGGPVGTKHAGTSAPAGDPPLTRSENEVAPPSQQQDASASNNVPSVPKSSPSCPCTLALSNNTGTSVKVYPVQGAIMSSDGITVGPTETALVGFTGPISPIQVKYASQIGDSVTHTLETPLYVSKVVNGKPVLAIQLTLENDYMLVTVDNRSTFDISSFNVNGKTYTFASPVPPQQIVNLGIHRSFSQSWLIISSSGNKVQWKLSNLDPSYSEGHWHLHVSIKN
jgi:hypothetical protein